VTIRLFAALLLFGQLTSPRAVAAQAPDGLNIVISQHAIASDGGERRRVWARVDAAAFGQTRSVSITQYRANSCAGGIGDPPELASRGLAHAEAPGGKLVPVPIDSAWTVDVTPVRISGSAATFKLKWVRTRHRQQPSTSPGADLEITLRPGQSLPLDMVSNPPPTNSMEPCVSSLRVGVEYRPEPEADRRLLAVDMWLVERLPDGTERSQPQALRGVPNNGMPFYFDRITEGAFSFDLFGEVSVAAGTGQTAVSITLRNRVNMPLPPGIAARPADYYYIDVKRVTATLALEEVVSVVLPQADANPEWRVPEPKHSLSLRIRVRQLR
jgi:hypothetical protein